jgi:hypothetical protein
LLVLPVILRAMRGMGSLEIWANTPADPNIATLETERATFITGTMPHREQQI